MRQAAEMVSVDCSTLRQFSRHERRAIRSALKSADDDIESFVSEMRYAEAMVVKYKDILQIFSLPQVRHSAEKAAHTRLLLGVEHLSSGRPPPAIEGRVTERQHSHVHKYTDRSSRTLQHTYREEARSRESVLRHNERFLHRYGRRFRRGDEKIRPYYVGARATTPRSAGNN